jgi:hypothetical protein
MPITVMTGYLRFSLLNKLIAQLRVAYEGSAHIACEQVAAIRTVVALNREVSLQKEYVENLKAPVRKALFVTLRSTFVTHTLVGADGSYLLWDRVWLFLRMLWCFGMGVVFSPRMNTP